MPASRHKGSAIDILAVSDFEHQHHHLLILNVADQAVVPDSVAPETLLFTYPTTFTKVPIGGMVMRILSPCFSVNDSGGTTPVPVSKKHPCGKLLLR